MHEEILCHQNGEDPPKHNIQHAMITSRVKKHIRFFFVGRSKNTLYCVYKDEVFVLNLDNYLNQTPIDFE